MKQAEKNSYERIKEKIRKETGYLLKNLNKKNIKRELESFIYTIANCYNDSWTSLSYLDEIETEYASCIKFDSNAQIVFKASSIIEDIFQAEAKEYADSLDGILKLAINNNQIFKALKEDIPSLREIREIFKPYKAKQLDFEPIYENLSCFYLNYNYNGNIKDFIKCLNAELKQIVDNKKILDDCVIPEEGGTIHE